MNFQRNLLKLALIILLVAVALPSGAQLRTDINQNASLSDQFESAASKRGDVAADLLDYAYQFRGVRYRHGANGPTSFDCSGFTSYVFRKFGYSLDRTSGGQINDGTRVKKNELQPGDLVFFNGRAIGNRIGHVGIVVQADNENGTFRFIHAASRGVTVSNSTESYYARRYMGACRVLE